MDRGDPSPDVLVFSQTLWTLGVVLSSEKGELKDDGVLRTRSPVQTLPTFPAHPFPLLEAVVNFCE